MVLSRKGPVPARSDPFFIAMAKKIVWFACLLLYPVLVGLHPDAGLIAASLAVVALSVVLERGKLWVWLPALAISWTWIAVNHDNYAGYNYASIRILGISLLPILAWPTLLVTFYFAFFPLYRAHCGWRLWARLSGTLFALLVAMEYVGYHWLDIHLKTDVAYAGWPLLDVFHCPVRMQVCYFLNCALFCAVLSLARRRPEPPRAS